VVVIVEWVGWGSPQEGRRRQVHVGEIPTVFQVGDADVGAGAAGQLPHAGGIHTGGRCVEIALIGLEVWRNRRGHRQRDRCCQFHDGQGVECVERRLDVGPGGQVEEELEIEVGDRAAQLGLGPRAQPVELILGDGMHPFPASAGELGEHRIRGRQRLRTEVGERALLQANAQTVLEFHLNHIRAMDLWHDARLARFDHSGPGLERLAVGLRRRANGDRDRRDHHSGQGARASCRTG
jgi:hypothetical protein